MFLEWSSIYSVGIEEFDSQHRKLFEIINEFYSLKNEDEFRKNKDEVKRKEIEDILLKLEDYGNYHLKSEEDAFSKYNYPDKERHQIFHDKYRERISEFKENLNNTNNLDDYIDEVAMFLRKWWLKHIQKVDQEYTDYLNKEGLF